MRLHRGFMLLAVVLVVLVVSACGSSNSSSNAGAGAGTTPSSSSSTTSSASASSSASSGSNPMSAGAPVGSAAMRSELEQEILGTAGIKAPEAKKIVDCIITKLNAAGITTNGEAAAHESQLTQLSTTCAEQVAGASASGG
jgi:hypothetical protein